MDVLEALKAVVEESKQPYAVIRSLRQKAEHDEHATV